MNLSHYLSDACEHAFQAAAFHPTPDAAAPRDGTGRGVAGDAGVRRRRRPAAELGEARRDPAAAACPRSEGSAARRHSGAAAPAHKPPLTGAAAPGTGVARAGAPVLVRWHPFPIQLPCTVTVAVPCGRRSVHKADQSTQKNRGLGPSTPTARGCVSIFLVEPAPVERSGLAGRRARRLKHGAGG